MPMGSITINIRDGQLGITGGSIDRVGVVVGVCSGVANLTTPSSGAGQKPASGTLATPYTLYSFSQPGDIVKTLGYGPGSSAAANVLGAGAQSVYVMPISASDYTPGVLANNSGPGKFISNRVTTINGDSTGTITGTGAPSDAFKFKVKIVNAPIATNQGAAVSAGNVGIQVSIDGGVNYGPYAVVPPSGIVPLTRGTSVLGDTNTTITLDSGYFAVGDTYTNNVTQPFYGTSAIGSALTGLQADPRLWSLLNFSGIPDVTTDAVTNYGTVAAGMTTLQSQFRYARAMMCTPQDAGGDSTIFTDWASSADNTRVWTGCNTHNVFDILWGGVMERSSSDAFLSRLCTIAPSHSPGYVDDGSLYAVFTTNRDERATPGAFDQRFGCTRTVPGRGGLYFDGDGRMHVNGTSDFENIMNCRVMDEVCTALVNAAIHFQNMTVRLNDLGQIAPQDASKIQKYIYSQIQAVAGNDISGPTSPQDMVTVYVNDNILSTQTLRCLISIIPFGYFKSVQFDVGFENPVLASQAV
jgi:hypothetical protein